MAEADELRAQNERLQATILEYRAIVAECMNFDAQRTAMVIYRAEHHLTPLEINQLTDQHRFAQRKGKP